MKWFLYIVECRDGLLYTGITTDISRRLKEHNAGLGASSLKGKLPVKLRYYEEYSNKYDARKREKAIKNWKRGYKLKLILNKTRVYPVKS